MTPFERALRERMKAEGPITVEAYMDACNAYYYATRDPLGEAGDFTTSPEISQMFGELIGAALTDCWKRAGAPDDAVYAELGPGRGTLAADALRVLRGAGFRGDVHLVETSPPLREAQASSVGEARWHESIGDLPKAPVLLVANEFLDALPVRQLVGGIERRVAIAAGGLTFDRDGEVIELSPAREAAVRSIAEHLVRHGGAALIIDYGHVRSGRGDTLQAVRGHRYVPILADPGEHDLTAHVDFEAVARAVRDAGASVSQTIAQGPWLRRLGIGARAAALATANPERVPELEQAVERLCQDGQMGQLFKVIAVHAPDWPRPVGFE